MSIFYCFKVITLVEENYLRGLYTMAFLVLFENYHKLQLFFLGGIAK